MGQLFKDRSHLHKISAVYKMADEPNEEEKRARNVYGKHEDRAFTVLKELRDNGELMDVTLQVGGNEIQAHRVVLAACSPYFRAMLTTGFAETFMSTIALQDCDPAAVEQIVEYFYSRTLSISQDNIEGLLAVASLFEIPEVVMECGEFIEGEIGVENCLGIQSLASQFSLSSLKSKIDNFVSWKFMEVVREEEFVLIPADQLKEIISKDTLHVNGEEDVFEAVMVWYDHDQQRMHNSQDVMTCVRFDNMEKQYLSEIASDEDLMHVPSWKAIVHDALGIVTSPVKRKKTKIRQSPNALYLLGELYSDPVQMFDIETCSCCLVDGMKENVGTAVVVDNTLYMVIGGGLMVDRYNPRLNYWARVADGFKEAEFAACGSPGRIYVFGGGRRAKSLDLKSREWVSLPPMSMRRNYHAAVSLQETLYVSGGVTPPGDQGTADVESFNPSVGKWESLPPMNDIRYRHELVAFNDHVYAIGGCGKMGTALKTVEMYDKSVNCWHKIQDLVHPRKDFAVGVLQGMMFVFGGGGGTTTVEQYNRDADNWKVVGALPKRWCNFRCVSLPFINVNEGKRD